MKSETSWQVRDIDLASARVLVDRAVDKAEQLGLAGGIVVIGASGALITGSRMDDGGAGGMTRARSKAWISATQRIPSTVHLHRMGVVAPAVATGFPQASPEAVFPGAGGMPVRQGRRIVGGIATSGSTVSPFFPAGIASDLMIADGRPANPEDLLIAYALEIPYEGQHGDDLKRWETSFGTFPTDPPSGLGMVSAPRASGQHDLMRCRHLVDAVLEAARAEGQAVSVCVVDRRGDPIQHDAMDRVPAGAAYVAEAAAAGAALFGVPSRDLRERLDGLGSAELRALVPVPVAAVAGAVPLRVDGTVVAAIGVAGLPPDQCHELAAGAIAGLG